METELIGTSTVDALLVHCKTDENLGHLIKHVLQERKIRCSSAQKEIVFGNVTLFPGVERAVKGSDRIIVILSRDFLATTWCSLVFVRALEKAISANKHGVILLLVDIEETEVPDIPVFEKAIRVDTKYCRPEDWLAKLVKKNDEAALWEDMTPAGNFAPGQAWSHYCGYLRIILPELKGRIEESPFYRENPQRMATRFYMLLPKSCFCPGRIDADEKRVKFEGTLDPIEKDRGGVLRKYTPSVYSVRDIDDEKYFFVGEFPSVIGALYNIEAEGFAFLGEDKPLEVERFFHTMNLILNHPGDEGTNNMVQMIPFDDKAESETSLPSTHLLKAIKTDLGLLREQALASSSYKHLENMYPNDERYYTYDSCVLYCEADKDLGVEIRRTVEKNGFRCYSDLTGNVITMATEAVQQCRWTVFILSQEAIDTGWLTFDCLCHLYRSTFDNRMRVIVVLVDVDYSQIPEVLRYVTFINRGEKDAFMLNVLQTIKGSDVILDTHIPSGDVAPGLAMAYFVNYLRYLVPSIPEGISDAYQRTSFICPKKYYLVIPSSCVCHPKIQDEEGRISPANCPVKTIYRNQAGTVNREYTCKMYRLKTRSEKVYHFVGEYPPPILVLHEMSQMTEMTGLTREKMVDQACQFQHYLQRLLKSNRAQADCRDICRILYVDDQITTVGEALTKAIEEDLRRSSRQT